MTRASANQTRGYTRARVCLRAAGRVRGYHAHQVDAAGNQRAGSRAGTKPRPNYKLQSFNVFPRYGWLQNPSDVIDLPNSPVQQTASSFLITITDTPVNVLISLTK
ncbi:hypothetical protein AMECASPLE_029466 [Ameca splendens]|uniref:Uncharacterized protein n=1 Tax=Ameca splendens TaxID=208324 RepID=A0ABV1AC35_9TELE